MILMLLVFLSSAFVPTESMPGPLAWFAEHQPFTPIIETLRGLLFGTPIGDSGLVAVGWCVVISVAGYLWARRLYERVPARAAASLTRAAIRAATTSKSGSFAHAEPFRERGTIRILESCTQGKHAPDMEEPGR